jgi:alcohol dehydrogenase class IV
MLQTFNMGRTPPVTFGAGRVRKLPDLVAQLGGGPVLIVADAALAELGVTDRVTTALSAKGIAWDLAAEIAGEPKDPMVDALTARARDLGAGVVIALGGGAAMDAAKLVAAIARSGAPALDFALSASPLPQDGIPAIAVPTTAGTGSEVTRTAIVSTEGGLKNWYYGEELAFAQAVLDPQLTLTLPPHLTAWTGVDAVAHALEGATARATSPAGLLYGLEALRILSEACRVSWPTAATSSCGAGCYGRAWWRASRCTTATRIWATTSATRWARSRGCIMAMPRGWHLRQACPGSSRDPRGRELRPRGRGAGGQGRGSPRARCTACR